MSQQHAAAIAVAILPLSTAAFSAEPGDGPNLVGAAIAAGGELITHGYRVAPALMLGMIMLCFIPALVIFMRVRQKIEWSVHASDLDRSTGEADLPGDSAGAYAPMPGHAFLEVVGGADARFAILRDMLRIGREDDNDIRIPSRAVHGYHAAIHREEFGDYHITDLTGPDGYGVIVNGRPCGDSPLHDGDVIQLGPGTLRFHAGLV